MTPHQHVGPDESRSRSRAIDIQAWKGQNQRGWALDKEPRATEECQEQEVMADLDHLDQRRRGHLFESAQGRA